MSQVAFILALFFVTATVAGDEGKPIVISPAQEVALGEKARTEFLATHPLSTDGNLSIRIDEIGRTVVKFSDRPSLLYRFLVVQGDDLQAYSFPGGTVCLTESLARLLVSDDELAFALGHEVAHVALRHHVAKFRLRHGPDPGSPPERAMLEAVMSRFDKDQEMEADRYGALYVIRAGYRYSGTHEALVRIERSSPRATDGATHPGYDERIAMLKGFKRELDLSLEAFHAGTSALRTGELDEAISSLEYFLAGFPHSVAGQVNMGAAYLAKVRGKSGTPHGLAEALPILPDPGITVRGSYDQIDLENARRHFLRALEAGPNDPTALAGLALVEIRLGELEAARGHLDDALSVDPHNPELLLCSGNVHYLADEYEEARVRYLTALTVRAEWMAAKRNLAMCYEKLGQFPQAMALWDELAAHERYRLEAAMKKRDLKAAVERAQDARED